MLNDHSNDTHPHGVGTAASARDGGGYSCPMHPEVRQPAGGACPECGMALEAEAASTEEDSPELADMTRRFWSCAVVAVPVLFLGMAEMMPSFFLAIPMSRTVCVWMQFVLATPVVFWGGWPFYQRAWASVTNHGDKSSTLISLGVGAAWLFSLAALLFPHLFPESYRIEEGGVPVYFESAAAIVTLVLLGRVLELRAWARAGDTIRSLMALPPEKAFRVVDDGEYEEVPLARVAVGDRLRVRPREKVPVDGTLLSGTSTVTESAVTGEPSPVAKGEGDPVAGGTLNRDGGFIMRADRVGRDTLVARIVRTVSEARRGHAPTQRTADLAAAWLIPAVLLVAVATLAVWSWLGPEARVLHGLVNAVAVLVIASPSALGLATPMAVTVGAGRGAVAGVWVKDAGALELLDKIDTLVVDKTGTITEGTPHLVSVVALPGYEEDALLGLAASLGQHSEHPLSRALVRGARRRGLVLSDAVNFRAVTGKGVVGDVDGHAVVVGSRLLFEGHGIDGGELYRRAETQRRDGCTVTFIGVNGRPAGMLGVADPIKRSSYDAVEELRGQGLRIVMLTGDDRLTARAVAHHLGIEGVEADVSPEEKGAVVRRLRESGARVAVAGDGTNDAPALAQAHVGIAMSTGADVATESAGITLLRGDLRALARARGLSRETLSNIRQNLALAAVYNVVGVAIAAGALYPALGLLVSPMAAAAAMTLGSLSVIANSLRLRRRTL